MEIGPITVTNWNLEQSEKRDVLPKKSTLYEDPYELDIEINLQDKNDAPQPEDTGSYACQSYGCGRSNYCTQPNSQCICSGNNCGGTVCSHC